MVWTIVFSCSLSISNYCTILYLSIQPSSPLAFYHQTFNSRKQCSCHSFLIKVFFKLSWYSTFLLQIKPKKHLFISSELLKYRINISLPPLNQLLICSQPATKLQFGKIIHHKYIKIC